MHRLLLLGIVLAAALPAPATAGLMDDCRAARQPGARVNACIMIIDSRSFDANAKALAFQYLGEARSDAGAFQPAIADFNRAIRLRTDNAQAFAGRARARFSLGDFKGALSDFGRAIGIFPGDAELYLQRGHVFLAHGDTASAIVDLNEAIRLNPKIPSAYNNRGLALRRKGDNDAALRDYDTAIAMNPAFALAYANRGALREATGARASAIEDFQHALYLDPLACERTGCFAPARPERFSRAGKRKAHPRRQSIGRAELRQLPRGWCSRRQRARQGAGLSRHPQKTHDDFSARADLARDRRAA